MSPNDVPESPEDREYPEPLRAFVDEAPWERESIVAFIAASARSIPAGARVLDVGAGAAPYRSLFDHTEYVTADWAQSLHAGADALDIVAPADDLPCADASFDAVICTQVLEHVPEPLAVLAEMHRVLDDRGRLYLTAPLTWEEHEMPFDFFRYTRSGLDHLLTSAGFTDLDIRGRTDSFTTIGQLLSSARWSLGEATDETAEARQKAFARLSELADEVVALAPLDARRTMPLGFAVIAERPARAVAPSTSDEAPTAVTPAAPTRIPVLYIAPWVDLGGSDKGTIDWFKNLDREQWAPSLITTQPSPNRWVPALEPYAEEVWPLPELMAGSEFGKFILGFIESRGVRVVHIMNSRMAFDLLPDISSLPDPPAIVVQLHAEEPDRSGYVRYASTRFGSLVDAYSVTSRQLADAMHDFHVPRSKLRVITTGVDAPGEFNPDAVAPFDGLKGDGPRILWPGRLVDQKDPLLTLEVVRLLVDRGVSFVLDVVGDGLLEDAVRARAEAMGVADRIRWYPPSHEMPRWYRTADLLLMTSVFEGVPYVVYEALAMGVPVVVPALAGNVELLDHPDGGGVLIDPRDDASAYADAIQRLLEHPDERRNLGERARARMLRDFGLREMAQHHEDLYRELMTKAKGRGVTPAAAPSPPTPPLTFPRDPAPERSVAVIVPCYRHGLFIHEAIDSIRAQTLPAVQIVVVDDASPDDETIQALNALDRDPAVTVLKLARNGGPSAARNRALRIVDANYVLPLDADDKLLPRALEDMVEQLEQAPDDVGFVYPNALHFGNRHDYYTAPSYNLHLLMGGNYCPATTLFDSRLFQAGVRYDEDLVGHEDWDLVLRAAERGVHGEPAEGPTFLYRKNGFSRINAVEYGSDRTREPMADQHPGLYARRDEIKARWAPALSVVLLPGEDEAEASWSDATYAALRSQTCTDFEVVRAGSVPGDSAGLTVSTAAGAGPALAAAAVSQARGRFVALLSPAAASSIERPEFIEQLLQAFWMNAGLPAVVLGRLPLRRTTLMTQLGLREARTASPVGVAWRREPDSALPAVDVEDAHTAISDIASSWELDTPVQWRAA